MRAIVGDAWAVLRGGVGAVLAQADVEVVGQAETARDLVGLVTRAGIEPEVVVVGTLRDAGTVTAIAALLVARPTLRVLALLDSGERDETVGALDAGAAAVIPRAASEAELREGVVRVLRGERFVAPALVASAFGPAGAARAPQLLTDRELAVLEQLAAGSSNRQIAAALFIGEATVKTHLSRIYEKLGAQNRVQALSRARERNLLGSSSAALV